MGHPETAYRIAHINAILQKPAHAGVRDRLNHNAHIVGAGLITLIAYNA